MFLVLLLLVVVVAVWRVGQLDVVVNVGRLILFCDEWRVCMSLLLFFSWRCCRRRRRARAFIVTDAGLSCVASRATKRLMDNALLDCPLEKIPPSGRCEIVVDN